MLSELDMLSEDLLMFIRPFLLISAFLACFLLMNCTIVFLTNFYFYQCDGMLQYQNLRSWAESHQELGLLFLPGFRHLRHLVIL